MTYRPVYLDTSALAKLVILEAESAALLAWLREWPDWISSALTRVEMGRFLRRGKASAAARRRAAELLAGTALIRVDDQILQLAADLRDPKLRSIDAVHLATALSIGDVPEVFITYDKTLTRAAEKAKLTVMAPA